MTLKHPEAQKLLTKCEFQLRKMLDDNTITVFAFAHSTTRSKNDVIDAIVQVTGVHLSKIFARTRRREIVRARQLLAYCLRRMAKMTYPAIAELMKYGDHTSVMHSENEVVDRLMEGDMDTCSPLIKIYSLFESQDKSQAV